MRKVRVITSLAAVLALMVIPVGAETLFGTEPPDVQLAPGSTANDTFDLNDFFDTTTGTISYTATGASVNASGVASVFGLPNPGTTQATFTATQGANSLTANSSVYVSNFSLGNTPAIDNNNKIAGVAGGNLFLNLVPNRGGSVSSVLPLTNLPSGGGSASPGGVTGGGVTGAAALIATIASVNVVSNDVTGLRSRVVNGPIVAESDGSAAIPNVLTATLNADGTYALVGGTSFNGPLTVTLGARAGASADAAHLVVARAADVALSSLTSINTGQALAANGQVTIAPGASDLFQAPAVAVNGRGSVTLWYNASAVNGVAIAAIGFDGALAFQSVSFANASGPANLQPGQVKALSVDMTAGTSSIIPAFQVFNGGSSAVTVTISRVAVGDVGPVTDLAVNVNAKAALGVDGSIANVNGWIPDVNGQGASGPVAESPNHYASASGSGSMALNGKGGVGIANGTVITSLKRGSAVAEAYVHRVGDADAGAAFAMVITVPGQNSISAFKPGSSLPTEGWLKVSAGGTLSADAAQAFLTIQCAGVNAHVDDVSIRVVGDKDNHFDAALLGGL